MRLQRLAINNVRILKTALLEPGPGLNLVTGSNGSGKTSVLEAINILARTRSFRSNRFADVIRRGEKMLAVEAIVEPQGGSPKKLSVCRTSADIKVSWGNEVLSRSAELVRMVPLIVVLPGTTGLLEGPPKDRRRLLDWLLFHVERDFMQTWQVYFRAMRQRSAVLRTGAKGAGSWEHQMASSATQLDDMRSRAMQVVEEEYRTTVADLLPEPVRITWRSGWDREKNLAEVLAERRSEDTRLGFAASGPHRMDITLRTESGSASRQLSRGQMKLAVTGLYVAFARAAARLSKTEPLFLLDDFGAELDSHHAGNLAQLLSRLDTQAIVTTTDSRHVDFWPDSKVSMFHVEQGRIQPFAP